ncbi:hypothetical protein TRFO_24026 [Tritrichomonas foetus]|uniref:Leucine Rich Repeat family protein n=1 Tax=Tritrichomonas foetus TaxID=1144522 RepID=A0A1J4K9V2_9EUKA|nr:hypothetical protein TRFO_24026 [Tritrichomonas foetus]|eukprot:OHT07688.1 hypothetical protein TRFO_24026 [Tritrichomonas foetus]
MMDREFLTSLCPIFSLKEVKILWEGTVYKVGQTNILQPRTLVIASPGIFLIRKRSFAFQSKIVNAISFFDLASLYVTEQFASFSTKQYQIRIKLQSIRDVASLVFFIRQYQFPTDILPMNFTFADDEFANNFSLSQLPYQPTSLFIDRTLACMMHFNIVATDTQLSSLSKPKFRIFTIHNEMLMSPLFQAWILSLSFEQDVEVLKFENIQLSLLLEQCSFLFCYNRFIKTVEFRNVDFENSHLIISKLFSETHNFKPIKWVFEDCDLTKPCFNKFIDGISGIGTDISELHFTRCKFNEDTYSTMLQSIFFNECFHSLNGLALDYIEIVDSEGNQISNPSAHSFSSNTTKENSSNISSHSSPNDSSQSKSDENNKLGENESIDNTPNVFLMSVSEILCCSWAMQKKCLHYLSLKGCKSMAIDMSPLLSQILNFDFGINEIDFNENSFLQPLSITENILVHNISFLGLRRCKFSRNFLFSLIQLLKQKKLIIHGLDISNMIVDNDVFRDILNETKNISFPELETLFFNHNQMNANQTLAFTTFLQNQQNLKNLSINNSFDIHDSPKGLLAFTDFVVNQNLTMLSIHGNQTMNYSYGILLFNMLQKMNDIQILDVTNQCIGQEGLEYIIPYINDELIMELHFDGSNVKSFDFLCKFCSTIISSKMKFSSFPEKDFKNCLNLISNVEELNTLLKTVNDLRNAFASKFGTAEQTYVLKSKVIMHTKLQRLTKELQERKLMREKNNSTTKIESESKLFEVNIFDETIEPLYKECIGNDQPVKSIVNLMSTINETLSFDHLFSLIQK